jgi:hypothetical protein
MDLRSVVLFLARKFSKTSDIHKERIVYLGTTAIGYSTVTKYLRSASFTPKALDAPVSDEFKMIHEVILKTLERTPISSVHELAGFKCFARSPVHRHLRSFSGVVVRNL